MKNQYFGDINDYRKYGLLRQLTSGDAIRATVCWMLTEGDGRADGKFTTYLEEPEKWAEYDPELFTMLRESVHEKGIRSVSVMERTTMLTRATYYSRLLTDSRADRVRYHSECLKTAAGSDLIFFDPDNGMEVKSVPKGRKNSSKYLYWDEVRTTYHSGFSLLVYQHFRREKRREFIDRLASEFRGQTGANRVDSYRTAQVVFFLVPQRRHEGFFQVSGQAAAVQWHGQITRKVHCR